MVVRNVVRSPVRAVVQSVFGASEAFNPFQLFTSGAQGAWYDPSDMTTLYQDANGTTPVTAVEQPVRLMLDRSKGLVLGSELAPAISALTANIDTSGGSTSTFSAGVWSITGASSITGYPRLSLNVPGIVIGRRYLVTFSATWTGGTVAGTYVRLALSGASNDVGTLTTSGGTLTARQVAAATDVVEIIPTPLSLTTTGTITITSLSVRELPGNHALAPNDASRPILRARYNLLTRTEEFDDGAWVKTSQGSGSAPIITQNAGVAPDGTMTAERAQFARTGTTTVDRSRLEQINIPVSTSTNYVFSVWMKSFSGADQTVILLPNYGNGVALVATVTSAWQRFSVSANTLSQTTAAVVVGLGYATNSITSADILIWGASFLTAADHAAAGGAYQRVGAATDYDTGPPWRPYLAFDGSDDSMSTSSIDFSGTDKMTVFAGVSKLSDATQGMLLETSTNVVDGGVSFFVPSADTTPGYRFTTRGTATSNAIVSVGYAAPVTNTLTGISDISGDVVTLRVNGTQVASSASDQGTGNFGNYPLFIGRRAGSSLPFNGRLYGLTVLGRTATAPELTAMESWIAGKTGVSL